jgi:hypothetical protein
MTRRQDHLLRYEVPSHTRREVTHVVELDMYRGNGACTCEHFHYKLEPKLKAGAPRQDSLRCHHINEARARLLDDVIDRLMLNEEKKR